MTQSLGVTPHSGQTADDTVDCSVAEQNRVTVVQASSDKRLDDCGH